MPATDDAIPASRRVCLVCQQEYSPEEKRCPKDGTLLVALVADPYIGKTLEDRYAVESLIGTGGTSIVYKAQHLQLKRPVAIKMLKAHLVGDDDSKRRFEQEARAVSCLTHPHVLNVFDVGVTKYGEPYIVMEFLEGTSLAELILKYGRLPVDRALHIFVSACSAIAHAHKKDVVHRDVKPSNIMLIDFDGDRDYVKIVDFGLAKLRSFTGEFQKLTKTGEVFGSPVYMSPEQCTGKKLDGRTDVYSMGVVMFETLTGRPPFKERTSIETIRRQIKDPPPKMSEIAPDAEIPRGLEIVVQKALAKNPEDRFQTIDDLRVALEFFDVQPASKAAAKVRRATSEIPKRSATSLIAEAFRQPNHHMLMMVIMFLGAVCALAIMTIIFLLSRP